MAFATALASTSSRACASSAQVQERPRGVSAPPCPHGGAALRFAAAHPGPRHVAASSSRSKRATLVTRATAEANNGTVPASGSGEKPVVKIDNQTDAFATIVKIKFGDKLGDLLDTMASLKNLGLNIRRAKIENPNDTDEARNTFYVTDAAKDEKITSSEKLEEIRLTILNNMLSYHPDSAESLSMGSKWATSVRDTTRSLGAQNYNAIETKINLKEDPSGRYTILSVQTSDRPGLLVDMVHILKDVSVNVLSAEVDTVGKEADDTLLISYHGEALNGSMQQLVKNALQYYLSLAEIAKDESY